MILGKRRHEPNHQGEIPNFWAAYSDLMAGMLLVFALLLIVAMVSFADHNRRKGIQLQAQELKLISFHALQQALIKNLEEAFAGETVLVDPDTGVLQIQSGILFGEGEARLRPEVVVRLNRIFDAYIRVVLSAQFRDAIKQIEIEGHTNSRGGYLSNLELSQQRALSVMKAFLDRAGNNRATLQKLVIAGGRSYSDLVYDAQGVEDKVASRRIEIKFRLKEAEMFLDIYQDLAE